MSDDEKTVLRELYGEHTHPTKPHEWMRACDLSGPMGSDQARAIRSLQKRGLLQMKRGSYANRYRRKLWRLTELGFDLGRLDREYRVSEVDKQGLAPLFCNGCGVAKGRPHFDTCPRSSRYKFKKEKSHVH